MKRVAIIGATGYTAWEAMRILLVHPQAEVTYLTALKEECGPVAEAFPALEGRLEMEIEELDLDRLASKADVALCCLPHKASMSYVGRLLGAGLKVVDFSADYRMRDASLYEQVYQVKHVDRENLAQAAFGLPELFRDQIVGAKLVANPGCYPTAASLALAPLLKEGLVAADDIVVNAVSGVTGAGRKASLAFHYPEMSQNLFAYSIGAHRHQPEIEQILRESTGQAAEVLFVPHVAAFDRGIAESIYCRPLKEVDGGDLLDLYDRFYADEPFVRVLPRPPKLKDVVGTNFVDVYPMAVKGKVAVFATIDNLTKGAAGQAIQNMNLICGLEETMGLI